ncbi:MAG: DUF4426 domain-containing protein [Pseudomonadales bacterium]
MNSFLKITLAIALFCVAVFTQAEQKEVFGDFEVHYSIIPTSFIPQEAARAYKIVRAGNRMLLNISVRRLTPDDPLNETAAQAATVSAVRHDLMRPFDLDFNEIKEPGAIYYVSDFPALNEELSRFKVKVQVPEQPLFEFEFIKKMYVEK